MVCQAFQTSRHEKTERGQNWHDSKQPYYMIDISTVTDKTVENIKPHLTNIITHATQAVVDSESHLVSTLGQHVSTALSGVFGTTTLEQTEPLTLN